MDYFIFKVSFTVLVYSVRRINTKYIAILYLIKFQNNNLLKLKSFTLFLVIVKIFIQLQFFRE